MFTDNPQKVHSSRVIVLIINQDNRYDDSIVIKNKIEFYDLIDRLIGLIDCSTNRLFD